MAFELAARVSALGEAILTRFIQVGGVSYCVYTTRTSSNGSQFYSVPVPPVPDYNVQPAIGSEEIIGGPLPLVNSFSLIASGDPGDVVFVYDDGSHIWRFGYNFISKVLFEAPNKVFAGNRPVLIDSPDEAIALYLRSGDVQKRSKNPPPSTGFGAESTIVSPSSQDIVAFDAVQDSGAIARYTGAHSRSVAVPTQLRTDASTVLLYVIDNPVVSDLSGNGRGATYDGYSFFTGDGICFTEQSSSLACTAFTFGPAITIESWLDIRLSSRTTEICNGPVSLVMTDGRYFAFTFGTSIYRATLNIAPGKHYIALSHTFGNGSATFIAVDGSVLVGSWVQGAGNEVPSISGPIGVRLSNGEILKQFKISSIARSASAISDYMGGL